MERCSQGTLAIPDKEKFLGHLFSPADNRVYDAANCIVDNSWGQPLLMAGGIGLLLRIWHWQFYSYGRTLDLDTLVDCINETLPVLKTFRNRNILSLSEQDEVQIRELFNKFLDALKDGRRAHKSPVAVTKTLHLLAPEFFPMRDTQIAIGYGCTTSSVEEYICFCKLIKEIAEKVKAYPNLPKDRTLVKLIDEYNHSTRKTFKVSIS